MKLRSPSGDLGAQRDADASRFFSRKIKASGTGSVAPFSPMSPVRLAATAPVIGTLKGPSTTGGVVGGLKDKASYQGVRRRAGR